MFLKITGTIKIFINFRTFENVANNEYLVFIGVWDSGSTVTTHDITAYFCNGVRVTSEGYSLYNSQSDYSCTITTFTNRAGCWCRRTQANSTTCSIAFNRPCNVIITNPDFSQPWRDFKSDSEYYTYSISGYDPCHWVDINQKLTLTYNLVCYEEDYRNLTDWWYITYDGTTTVSTNFSSIIEDPNDALYLNGSSSFYIEFRLMNWRWMTEFVSFKSQIDSMDQLYGQEPATVEIDFSQIPRTQLEDYTIGGRIYMYTEIPSSRYRTNSYGFFFELKDYEEPTKKTNLLRIIIIVLISLAWVAFLGFVTYCYIRKNKKKKRLLKEAES
jgi:hypothetical protein